jgi:CRP-like cAMP-binding protein
MSEIQKKSNRLLSVLPTQDWKRMRPDFQEVTLTRGQVVFDTEQRLRRLYFPIASMISIVSVYRAGSTAEMATIGREGMAPAMAVMGSEVALNRHIVQVPGTALVIGYDAYRRLEHETPAFRRLLLAYAQAFLSQVLYSVACNAVHSMAQRAARWLLMTFDRRDEDDLELTQEFLAEMLGVSRPTVSLVARTFQRAGLIRYRRGLISIADRAGLEDVSCECYGIIRQHHERQVLQRLAPGEPERNGNDDRIS